MRTQLVVVLLFLGATIFNACSSSPAPKPSNSGEPCSSEGERRCKGNTVQICDLGVWANLRDCSKTNRLCSNGECITPNTDADYDTDKELEETNSESEVEKTETERFTEEEPEAEPEREPLEEQTELHQDTEQQEFADTTLESEEEISEIETEETTQEEAEHEAETELEEEPPFEPECTSDAQCDDSNPCTDDYCVGGFCQHVNHLGGCDDGNPCTLGDFCSNGRCVGGVDRNCSDGLDCTTDWCDTATGECHHELQNGYCLISNQCIPEGRIDPNNPCQKCNPSVRTDYYSPDDSLTCDDGLPCTTNRCSDGFCITLSITQGWCLINNTCYQNGAQMPGVECAHCVANVEQHNWTVDSGWCVINGQCVEEGTHKGDSGDDWCFECTPANRWDWTMLGTNMPCDDGLSCTILDHCDGAGHCTYTSVEQGWCIVNGECSQNCK